MLVVVMEMLGMTVAMMNDGDGGDDDNVFAGDDDAHDGLGCIGGQPCLSENPSKYSCDFKQSYRYT